MITKTKKIMKYVLNKLTKFDAQELYKIFDRSPYVYCIQDGFRLSSHIQRYINQFGLEISTSLTLPSRSCFHL